jgi:RNA polymerase sigma factor (sigma-70 family)
MRDISQIVAELGAALARVAASYEADPALQEDLMQEILLAVHRALPNLDDESKLAPFVFRVAHNRAVTHVAKQVAAKRARPDAAEETSAGPEQRLLANERSNRLLAAVRRLPIGQRQVVMLLLEDLSYAEIAEALAISVSNVGVRVNRAKAQLKALLHDER